MKRILHAAIGDIPPRAHGKREGYRCAERVLVGRGDGERCQVSVCELPPHGAYCPYHYHADNEEVFYILSGVGTLRTPEGERTVGAGDLIFFPACAEAAHKLTNASDTEPLCYIDFDAVAATDVTFYPDSGKVGMWGRGGNQVFRLADSVDYYDGE